MKFCRKSTGPWQRHEVAEGHARHEEERHHEHERQRGAALLRGEGRQDEGVGLEEDEGQREQQRGVARHGERRYERLRHAQRHRASLLVGDREPGRVGDDALQLGRPADLRGEGARSAALSEGAAQAAQGVLLAGQHGSSRR